MEFKDYRCVHDMLCETVERYADKDAYRTILDSKETESVTWRQFGDQVRQAAKSLIALGVEIDDEDFAAAGF